jgi:hypothetical protein
MQLEQTLSHLMTKRQGKSSIRQDAAIERVADYGLRKDLARIPKDAMNTSGGGVIRAINHSNQKIGKIYNSDKDRPSIRSNY